MEKSSPVDRRFQKTELLNHKVNIETQTSYGMVNIEKYERLNGGIYGMVFALPLQ